MGKDAASSHRAAVILPTFNNAGTVLQVLDRVVAQGLPVFVVDDGSTDATAKVLDRWQQTQGAGVHAVRVLRHERNQGKAAGLLTGFAAAGAAGFSHLVTLDTDLQHDPEEIPALLAASRAEPAALILGARRDDLAGMPARCLLGRRLSNRTVQVASGVRVTDSQSGFRVYPRSLLDRARCRSGRYSFETEIIVWAGWLGVPVREVPIASRYLPVDQRVSHFRPWRDSMRGLQLQLRLVFRGLGWRLRREKARSI